MWHALPIVILLATAGCRGEPIPPPPPSNVIVVTLDTMHVRYTSPYASAVDTTPVLQGLADEGVLFEHAHTPVPVTLPAHTTLFTGIDPVSTGVMANGDQVDEELTTLAEILKSRGYATGAFVSLAVLRGDANLSQGFDTYDDAFATEGIRWYRDAAAVVDSAGPWVETHAASPFLLWVHLSDPHEPYAMEGAAADAAVTLDGALVAEVSLVSKIRQDLTLTLPPGTHRLAVTSKRALRDDDLPRTAHVFTWKEPKNLQKWLAPDTPKPTRDMELAPEWTAQLVNEGADPVEIPLSLVGAVRAPGPTEAREAYVLEVAHLDRQLGRLRELVAAQGAADRTLWLVVSDHGEGLGYHRFMGHAEYTMQDQVAIYWTLTGPGVPAGVRVGHTGAVTRDVLPTLLDHLHLPIPDDVEGASRAQCWAEASCEPMTEWWSYGVENDAITSVARYQWPHKAVWHHKRGVSAYDLSTDPWEEADLYGDDGRGLPPALMDIGMKLRTQQRSLVERYRERGTGPLTDEQREMLHSLGYLDDH